MDPERPEVLGTGADAGLDYQGETRHLDLRPRKRVVHAADQYGRVVLGPPSEAAVERTFHEHGVEAVPVKNVGNGSRLTPAEHPSGGKAGR
ncbi:hypothetical protein [Methylobacterium sp. D48H]